MKFPMPKLPYGESDLEPYISRETLSLHYGEHLRSYVNRLNGIPSIACENKVPLEKVILDSSSPEMERWMPLDIPPVDQRPMVFDMATQVYNHAFYFRSMKKGGGGEPSGDMKEIIDNQYGSWDNFRVKVISRGVSLFGSGYVWICLDDDAKLVVINGKDSCTPLIYRGLSPLACIDVWEHSYYKDYGPDRRGYLSAVVDNLIDWGFASRNLERA